MNNNNDIENNIKENNKSNSNKEENNINIKHRSSEYKCVFHCPLNKNDCVNSIDIFNNYIAFGTIMGDVIFCRLEEENNIIDNKLNINNANTNITNNINNKKNRNLNDLNKTDSNISENNDIILKEDNTKEIILNINNQNKVHTKNLIKINNEEKTRSENNNPPYIKIALNGNGVEDILTDNYNSINVLNKKEPQKKIINNLINFDIPKSIKLVQGATENICCISLFNDILNFSVGDFELVHCEKITSFYGNDISMTHNFRKIKIYESDQTHSDFCENCSCLMSTNNFLITYSYYSDFNWPLRINTIKYQNRNLKTNEFINGYIKMSNYNIPFDFDGDNFLYIDFIDESKRSINILQTLTNKIKFKYLLDKKFGHISHMKFLPENCIFLCRNLCVCEVYKYKFNEININDNNFILLNMGVHNYNKEIISSNVYIPGNKISYEYRKNNYDKKDIYKNSQIKKGNKKLNNKNYFLHDLVHENENNSSIDSSNSKNKILGYENEYNYEYNNNILNLESEGQSKKIDKEEKVEEKIQRKIYQKDSLKVNCNDSDYNITQNKDSYYIITLDIEGNFNLYFNSENNKGVKCTLFNLYKIQNISQKKYLNFFSTGFPYYITMNEYYYVITSDIGVLVINKNK